MPGRTSTCRLQLPRLLRVRSSCLTRPRLISRVSVPATWTRGAFIPNMNPSDTSESPQGSPSGSYPNPNFGGAPADYGNYGITVSAVGAFARVWDLSIGPSSNYAPNGAQPMVQ